MYGTILKGELGKADCQRGPREAGGAVSLWIWFGCKKEWFKQARREFFLIEDRGTLVLTVNWFSEAQQAPETSIKQIVLAGKFSKSQIMKQSTLTSSSQTNDQYGDKRFTSKRTSTKSNGFQTRKLPRYDCILDVGVQAQKRGLASLSPQGHRFFQ